MKCPNCEAGEMIAGRTAVHGTTSGFLFLVRRTNISSSSIRGSHFNW